VLAAPALVALAAVVWGVDGALSAGYGIAIVLVNLVLSALCLGWAAPRGGAVLMSVALGGFLGRMILATVAILVVRDLGWVEMVPLGVAVLVAGLGLLFWETRYVSASLAFPGLAPSGKGA
jgi:hypothetical protein